MFIKFPSIEQFRHTVAQANRQASFVGLDSSGEPIYDATRPKPKIKFTGTVKVHGTNAGITRTPDGKILAQSRTRTLIAPLDNDGFRVFVEKLPDELVVELFARADAQVFAAGLDPAVVPVTIFGEWAGKGIQSGVAVSKVDKFFYIFALRAGEKFLPFDVLGEAPEHRVFNSKIGFPVWEVEVDFNDQVAIATAQNKFVELTDSVEKVCPVGLRFGENSTGEGIVWSCDDDRLTFKVKGKEHSSSHVTELAAADVEKIANAQAFVASVVSDSRVEQAIRVAKEEGKVIDRKITGDIVRWVVNDVLKEESDTISANALDVKAVSAAVGLAARNAYFKKLS